MSIGGALLGIVGNERCSPALLPYEGEITSEAEAAIKRQQERVDKLESDLQSLDEVQLKFVKAMQLEILRWNYLLQTYHSTRFRKIQTLMAQMTVPTPDNLSDAEAAFCRRLGEAIQAALEGGNRDFAPESGDCSGFVFFKALEDIGQMELSSYATSEPIDVRKNQICFARFEKVKVLLDARRAILL